MYYYNPKDRMPKEIVPGATIRTFWGDNALLSVAELEAGVEVPVHSHYQEQSGMVLEGEVEIGICGEVKTLALGDIYIIPGGAEHYVKACSSRVRVLDIFSPVRADYQY